MNARTRSNQARAVALIAAAVVSLSLFQAVASMGDRPQQSSIVVAQADRTNPQR